MDGRFTWLPFYKELSDWLLRKQNSQPELISKLPKIRKQSQWQSQLQ